MYTGGSSFGVLYWCDLQWLRFPPKNKFAIGNFGMKITAIILLLATTCIGFAQVSKTDDTPKRYSKFQGDWVVASMQAGSKPTEKLSGITVNVNGDTFTLNGSGVAKHLPASFEFRIPEANEQNPYRELQRRGGKKLDDIVDVSNQIEVFWFVGIYNITDEELKVALKYCGQGLEGQQFQEFRPPSSFDDEPTDGEVRIVLKRKKEAN